MKPLRKLACAAASVVAIVAHPAMAADPSGTWLTEGGKARVRVAPCGAALCGTIVWLREPNDDSGKPKKDQLNADAAKRNRPVVGVPIVLGMRPSGTPDKWSGQVYNAEDGKTYSGSLTITGASTLRLEGCALGGLACRSQTWTRAN
jgi:uncharacterized protein (DUF2147 family)